MSVSLDIFDFYTDVVFAIDIQTLPIDDYWKQAAIIFTGGPYLLSLVPHFSLFKPQFSFSRFSSIRDLTNFCGAFTGSFSNCHFYPIILYSAYFRISDFALDSAIGKSISHR